MGLLYVPSGNIQPIQKTNVSGQLDVTLSPAFASADDYNVTFPRAENSDGQFVNVKVVKYPTFVRLIVDEGFTAAFIECEVIPVGGG